MKWINGIFFLILFNGYCAAATIHVPGDYSSIQSGIDAAQTGDTVLVADGVYAGPMNKNLDFRGKSITVASENGPENCTISCGGNGRGVYFHQGETSASIFQGFSIVNGNSGDEPGGGIYCVGASPTIQSCIIENNTSNNIGGGIACHDASDAWILNCLIRGNTATLHGGGLHVHASQPTIMATTCSDNMAVRDGGGLYLSYSNATLFNCLITGNIVQNMGAGLFLNDASPVIRCCTVSENTAAQIGGMACWNDSSPVVNNSIFWGDVPSEIFVYSGTPVVTYSDVERDTVYPGTGNILADPAFISGMYGAFYLSHTASGQESISPCIDRGSSYSSEYCQETPFGSRCMDIWSVLTNGTCDAGIVDMGFHYPGPYFDEPPEGQDIPAITVDLDNVWKWDNDAGSFIDMGGDVPINIEEPTFILAHGWDSDLNDSMAAIAAEIHDATSENANILGWDWSESANPNGVIDIPDGMTQDMLDLLNDGSSIFGFSDVIHTVWADAWIAGYNARVQGGILGLKLSWLLYDWGTLGSEIHFIGHSHGGGLLAEAANRMYRTFGYQPTTLTLLDTPKVFCMPFSGSCLIDSLRFINPAAAGQTAVYYYSDRLNGGMGAWYDDPSILNVELNASLGTGMLHTWIHGDADDYGWYPLGVAPAGNITFPTGQFDSLLELPNFPDGRYRETILFFFSEDTREPARSEKTAGSDGWQVITHEPFRTIATWNGTNVSLRNGIDPDDPLNRVVLIREDGNGSFFTDLVWPDESLMMTFDYWFREPRGAESLTVYIDGRIVYYDNADITLATSGLMSSGEVYVGNVAGTTARLNFVLTSDGNSGGSVVIDNVRIYGLSCIHHGDVNYNGQVTAGDAQTAFAIALGVEEASHETGCAADCNGNGTVTAGDAQSIFSMALGIGGCQDPLAEEQPDRSRPPGDYFEWIGTCTEPEITPTPVPTVTPTPPPEPTGFVYIPPGSFTMGSPDSEPCRNSWDEDPVHTVILTRGFYMMQTEVTRQMWTDLGAAQPSLPADPSYTSYSPTMSHPVQRNTWYESVLYCNLLSLQNGYTRCYYTNAGFTNPITSSNYTTGPFYCNFNANGYRLPTESEWEYACRAGTTGPFSCNETSYTSGNCSSCTAGVHPVLAQYCVYCANDPGGCAVSGSKLPNPWGLHDMHGNVWEWCWDWYDSSYPSGTVTDPMGPSSGSNRVHRGGSWYDYAQNCRSADRISSYPGSRDAYLGFRPVRSAD